MKPAEQYIFQTPEPYRSIMLHLDLLIKKVIPEIDLKYKWRLPFYYLDDKTMFCFFNFRETYVDLGLPYGSQLTNQTHLIAGKNRKMMRSMRFTSLEEIDDKQVTQLLLALQAIRSK
ncbi:MAG: DUF1801 domain-containing protein [Bacteroidota bacterium]